ncbi:LysM peptidoglycan-binding domain-containing protein, partial [Burkholderia ubonensis]|uniref:LysM peptidoglycan-binding domain-containing protein n=1 Tax=Burkholderia ubonensis TaxID=101571 RepID=UPI000ADEF780
GQVQRRDELVGVSISADGTITGTLGDRKHNYYYLNGHRVGNVGNDGVEKVDYVQELAGKLGKGKESQYRVTTPVSVADFDENYLRIDGTYPGTSPGTWTVRDGDTLKSIASALWGDETLWYVLADANGLKSTDELKAGQTLTVPNKVTNVHNTASTFKPYDPGQAIGDTRPTLPDPPPPPSKGGGCGGFLPVIAIVVAVVATVFTAGALTAPAGAGLSGIMSAGASALGGGMGMAGVGASVVGGAVGAAASQGVMIAGGEQKGFNWKGVALGAVGAGVTAGVGGAMGGGAATTFGSGMVQGAARSVVTQGIGVATGLQHSFDWKGVAASAIASGVGAKVGAMTRGATASWDVQASRFATGVSAGVAAGATSTVVRGGSLGRNVGAITMDAVASTVGSIVVDNIASRPTTSALYGTAGDVNGIVADTAAQKSSSPNVFSMPANSTASNSALFGISGSLGVLDGLTSAAARDALASSAATAPHSAAATLYGPNVGFSTAAPLGGGASFGYVSDVGAASGATGTIGLAGGDADALLYAWNAQKRLSTDVRGGFDRQGNSTAGRAQYDLGGSWLADVPKLPVNLALNAVEGGVNLLSGTLPGTPDYVPFLNGAKIPYSLQASSYAEFGIGLLLGRGVGAVKAGESLAKATTVTTYRIEGIPNQRIVIGEAGQVSLAPNKDSVLWVNFGQTERATSYHQTKIEKGLPGAEFKSFEVHSGFVDRVRKDAVPERFARQYPEKPIISRDPYPDQFGLPKAYFEELMKAVIQGTGRNGQ